MDKKDIARKQLRRKMVGMLNHVCALNPACANYLTVRAEWDRLIALHPYATWDLR